jgi:signal peptidase II
VGNLIDRVRIDRVIDFVDMGLGGFRWYAWNVADAAVFLGIVCLFAAALLGDRAARRGRDAARPG